MAFHRELLLSVSIPDGILHDSSMLAAKASSSFIYAGCVFRKGQENACLAAWQEGITGTCNEEMTQKARQELLWHHWLSYPSDWWDNRAEKKSPRHPDFRHKTSKEPLWLNNSYKPAWVDLQLPSWDSDSQLAKGPGDDKGDSWVHMMVRRCEEAELRDAVDALDLLVQRGCSITHTLFSRVLKRCMAQKDLVSGRRVHCLALTSGCGSNAFLANHIIGMYASHGELEEAVKVFCTVTTPSMHMWSTIILAHARHGHPTQAISFYREMRESGVQPDNHIFVAALRACASAEDLVAGKQVHAHIQASPIAADIFVGNSLVSMYAKCGCLDDAREVFDSLATKDVVTWTAMIAGYSQQGLGQEALALYGNMENEGITPANQVTFVSLLQACASMGALQQGKQLHSQIRKRGLEGDAIIGNSLVNMYAKCGRLQEGRKVFDRLPRKDVVSWTAMIAGYSQQGLGQEALALYSSMQHEGITPANRVTFVCLLQACASVGALQQGKQLHSQIRENGLEADAAIGNSLVNMYAKCGSLEDARKVFDALPTRDVVSWTAMISGYSQQALGKEALSLYANMQKEGITAVDHVTFVCLLQACTSVGALQQGRELHSQIRKKGMEADAFIGSCLVDMYAKCGSLDEARRIFDGLPTRNSVTWTAMVKGYAENGDGHMAIRCFEDMLQQGAQPVETTFICLLVACSHAGLVAEGKRYFRMMVDDHGIVPKDYHYSCMVDLLGRSGQLDEAESMLRSTLVDDVVSWTALLTACKIYGDVERGQRCFDHLVHLSPDMASSYVLLGNIYANAGRWDDVDRIESLRKSAGAMKKAAKACIEVKSEVHEFTVGEDRSDISLKLRSVNTRLKEEGGHVPHTQLVLRAVSEQEKEDALCGHAEKLALAYGLLNTPNGTTLVVTKNLRMCDDCHSSTKIMSHLENREIIVRDAHRVHRFMDGSCSCGDRH